MSAAAAAVSSGEAGREGAGGWAVRWPGLGLCLPAGALAGLAHPPWSLLPGLLGFAAGLALLVRRAPGRPLRSGFARGWLLGAGYLGVCTSWIGEPFLIDAAAHGWQAPFALTLTPGLIALLWGLGGWGFARLAPQGLFARVLAFASLFAGCEWLRGHVLTGFPWDLPGEAWRAGSAPSQAAAFVGAYGLSWITLALASAPAALLGRESVRRRALPCAAAAAGLLVLYGAGGVRLAAHPMAREATGPRVRIVQPDLPEPAAVDEALVERTVNRYVELTGAPGPRPDIVVWPEGAVPAAFESWLAPGSPMGRAVSRALAPGQVLLTGGVRMEPRPDGGWTAFNSLLALRADGGALRALALYDKHHLVPFGEYMPFAALLEPLGLRKLVSNPDDFEAGPKPRPLALPALGAWGRLQPLICYEALFPSIAEGAPRAAWLVNISDDAWFGRRQGPWQHLNLASYRAIEEGLPMVRSTPTGVSALVDPLGRVVRVGGAPLSLAPSRAGVIDGRLPTPLAPTLFTRWRDAAFWVMVVVGLAPSLNERRRFRGWKASAYISESQ